MTNNNKRVRKSVLRKALFSSAISLILCCAMLVGTTFAWFTDSVTSANNIIKAGNLDIELEYWNGTAWTDVQGASDILTNTLYEPGVSEVAYLRVANAGSLALKYTLGINIVSETKGVNQAGVEFNLSDYIMFGVVEGVNGETGAYANRDAAVAAVTNAKAIKEGFSKNNILYPNGNGTYEEYIALVVYMPTTVGNEANHNGTNVPQIDLGINVFATQKDYESDSFGNDYDVNSPMKPADSWNGDTNEDLTDVKDEQIKVLTISTAEQLATFAQEVNAGNSYEDWTIELAANIDLANKPWTPIGNGSAGFYGTFDGKGYTVYNLNVSGTTSVGLFGYALNGGNIKNLNVENAIVSANDYAGAIIGRGYTDIVNCHVKNATITVTPYLMADGTTYDGGAKAGAVIGQLLEGDGNGVEGCTATNVYIKGYRDLGGVVGMVHNNNYAKNCSATNVTIEYIKLFEAYADNVKNENAGAVYGRKQASSVVEISDEANRQFTLVINTTVKSAAELQKAIDTAVDGNVIKFAADITTDSVTINQNPAYKLTIDGNGYKYDGTMNIKAASVTEAAGSILIKNVNFKTADAERTFITSSETNHYPLNVTVSNCSFEGTGADSNVVGISIKSAKNFTIEDCTATKVHSLLQNTSGWDLTIKDVTVTESGRGVALGTVQGVTLTNVKVDNAKKYGIRLDAGYNNNAIITDCEVSAFIPVVVRKVSVDSNMTFNGTNKMVQTNTDNIWCAIGASEYETNGTMPTAATATVTVNGTDTALLATGIYNNSGK